MVYKKIPIVDTARRCGLVLDSRTLRRREVEASCPFCGDHGKDDTDDPGCKYRWLSSRDMTNGTRSYSWVHVTGDITSKRAYLTEGPLKGDVASFLAHDDLFVCISGVNSLNSLTDMLRDLGVTEVVEAMDMDQNTKPEVRKAILAMRKEVQAIKRWKCMKYTWDPAYRGVDDYLLSRVTTT